MTPRLIIRRERSPSRHGHGKTHHGGRGLAAVITTLLLVVILVAGPLMLGATRAWVDLPLLALVAVLLMVQGLRLAVNIAEGEKRRADAIDVAVALFALYAVVRGFAFPADYFSQIEVMNVVAYAGVFFTCRYGMVNRNYCMVLLYALVILGTVETVFGYHLINHMDWFPFGAGERMQLRYAPRWIGTYDSPNHYASLLVMAIAAALALGSFSKLPWVVRIVLVYLAMMMILGVIFSGSRGSWVALVAAIGGLVIMAIRNGIMRWWIPVGAALALVMVSGCLLSVTPMVQTRLTNTSGELLGGRWRSDALQIVHDHLNYMLGYGVVGLGLVLFYIAAVTLKFFAPLWVDNRWQDRVLVATGFAAWVALLVHSLVDYNLHVPANALLLFSLTGLALGRMKEERSRHWSTISLNPFGRWMGVMIVALAILFGVLLTQIVVKDHIFPGVFSSEAEHP
jgi:hypothetical protein